MGVIALAVLRRGARAPARARLRGRLALRPAWRARAPAPGRRIPSGRARRPPPRAPARHVRSRSAKRSILTTVPVPSPPVAAAREQKKAGESLNNRLKLVVKSGKYTLGYKTVLKSLRSGKSKMVIICNNAPPLRKSEIEYYSMLSKTAVVHYPGNNVELGTACGRLYRCSCLSITDVGDSDILKAAEGQ